jgi:hypothetical protein
VQYQTANSFRGTHKGGLIEIEREPPKWRFYIVVYWKDGGRLYDGYAPETVTTMEEAKLEARKGACLDRAK